MESPFGSRRGVFIDISREMKTSGELLSADDLKHFERFDLIYRSLCALMFNYVPTSGHPGGSISSGRIASALLFDAMDYDVSNPDREEADIISYAAGHKALGIYSMWAMRDEMLRIAAPELLPSDEKRRLRLEDLLGFRRNPITRTPLVSKFNVKPLDGHPTPATPFIRLSTGASGVGVTTSLGLAFGASDYFGKNAPRVHIVEGEGGLTPGRVAEALTSAGTASLKNAVLHIDWNQASIDSNHVCRDSSGPGDYVQWNPVELAYFHDWNAILVSAGMDFQHIVAAQHKAASLDNGQPTAIVYRTTKGWQYGIEGKASHGAGHKLCSDGFYEALKPLLGEKENVLPRCEAGNQRCQAGAAADVIEECFWESLQIIRKTLEENRGMVDALVQRLRNSEDRLKKQGRTPRQNGPNLKALYDTAGSATEKVPEPLALTPGKSTTLRGELGRVLEYYNKVSNGAILVASADLAGSTSVSTITQGSAPGYFNAGTNPDARLLSIGGICEDAMSGILSGIATFGHHIGVGSSYAAFIAPLGHISARLHAIGNQARHSVTGDPYRPFILVCAHAGVKTGEDGPTHADPQPLQLLQENFPDGTMITLTPWDPQETWTLVSTALAKRPAVIAPFVTRPNEKILDRKGLGLADAAEAKTGVYLLKAAKKKSAGTVVLQGSEIGYAFVDEALPLLEKEGVELDVYYVASAELFNMLPREEQDRIFPPAKAAEAMGITGFTLPTMFHWIQSERGRSHTMHAFQKGHYLGSGQAEKVLAEAGLDGKSQFDRIMQYVKASGK